MKLSILSARVNIRRQRRQKIFVDDHPSERVIQHFTVNTSYYSFESKVDELPNELSRISHPHWIDAQ
jgi:hypothetical protein